MKNSADLGGCYPIRPSALLDNALLDLQNSSYPTQPHSRIAEYVALLYKNLRVASFNDCLGLYPLIHFCENVLISTCIRSFRTNFM